MLEESLLYGNLGAVEDVNFTLDLKLPLERMPKRGEIVAFRGENYKVSNIVYDSAHASIKLHLQSTSKG